MNAKTGLIKTDTLMLQTSTLDGTLRAKFEHRHPEMKSVEENPKAA
jgi:hypothetical protein